MSGPSLDLESLGHELLFTVRQLVDMRTEIDDRVRRIVAVAATTHDLLPSTRDAILKAAKLS